MKYKAVIFDLFGTLIDNFSKSEHKNILSDMASALGVPNDDFVIGWFNTFELRCKGEISSVEENITYICEDLNLYPQKANIEKAIEIRYDYTKKALVPKTGAINVLREIRKLGLKTGLITDCSSEVPKLWGTTSFSSLFDVCIFSCVVGIKKPNIEIYNLACQYLSINPEYCLYIGDGGSNELSGAQAAGMNPIMIRDQDEFDAHRIDEEIWRGITIFKFEEILKLIV